MSKAKTYEKELVYAALTYLTFPSPDADDWYTATVRLRREAPEPELGEFATKVVCAELKRLLPVAAALETYVQHWRGRAERAEADCAALREERADQSPTFYEVRDITDEDMYYSLGYFRTLEEARKHATEGKEPPSDNDHDESCTIGIYAQRFGYLAHRDSGRKVEEHRWVNEYNEATDEYRWKQPQADNNAVSDGAKSKEVPNVQ